MTLQSWALKIPSTCCTPNQTLHCLHFFQTDPHFGCVFFPAKFVTHTSVWWCQHHCARYRPYPCHRAFVGVVALTLRPQSHSLGLVLVLVWCWCWLRCWSRLMVMLAKPALLGWCHTMEQTKCGGTCCTGGVQCHWWYPATEGVKGNMCSSWSILIYNIVFLFRLLDSTTNLLHTPPARGTMAVAVPSQGLVWRRCMGARCWRLEAGCCPLLVQRLQRQGGPLCVPT